MLNIPLVSFIPFSFSPSALSQSSRSKMEPLLSLNNVPSEFSGHYNSGCAGATQSVQTTSQHYNIMCRKKSNVRLNDQLIPKPTDINVGERKFIPIPKEHPYSSHIPQFEMFPSFYSKDNRHAGVRAASRPFLNPPIPNSPPVATVLSKTMGGPYRHEILETPMKTRNTTVMWPGDHGFLDYTKPLKEKKQVFYPAPPKTVLPNSKLRDWELSLSERTSNMQRNLERAQWVTSYQLHYTGSGRANPRKTNDFKEKTSSGARRKTYNSTLTERFYPVFVPSKPNHGCKRQESCLGRRTSSPTAAELLKPSPHQHRPQEITAKHNEAPHLYPKGQRQSGTTEGVSERVSHEIYSLTCESSERERYKVQFDKSLMQVYKSQDTQGETDINREQPELLSRTDSSCSLLLRPPVLPGPVDRAGTLGREGVATRLLYLQNTFSKSEAHRSFNNSITHAVMDLRDNVVTGKRHKFFGVHSYYLHG